MCCFVLIVLFWVGVRECLVILHWCLILCLFWVYVVGWLFMIWFCNTLGFGLIVAGSCPFRLYRGWFGLNSFETILLIRLLVCICSCFELCVLPVGVLICCGWFRFGLG